MATAGLSIGGAPDPLEPSSHLSTTAQLEAGVSGMQGRRPDMQDAHLLVVPLPTMAGGAGRLCGSDRTGLFGVFDGHGGTYASKYGSRHMLEALQARPEWQQAWGTGMVATAGGGSSGADPADQASLLARAVAKAFLDVDAALKAEVARGKEDAGSTAVVTLVTDSLLVVGNAGDSRAVLLRLDQGAGAGEAGGAASSSAAGGSAIGSGGSLPQLRAVPLTHDHKPASPTEKARIEAAGSAVYVKRKGGVPRIDATDAFLLLACDGVWDVMSEEDVARLVTAWAAAGSGGSAGVTQGQDPGVSTKAAARVAGLAGTQLQAGPPPAVDMSGWAEALIAEAYQRGSGDNLTAMLVALPAGLALLGRGPVRAAGARTAEEVLAGQPVVQPQPSNASAMGMAEAPVQVQMTDTGTPTVGAGAGDAAKKPRLAGQDPGQPSQHHQGF